MSLRKVLFISCLCFSFSFALLAQEKVTFIASDKLLVTADLYLVSDTMPYMILCHDLKSSRGEYDEIAKKFNKLGYNCVAVDLRSGANFNGVTNETAVLAVLKHLPNTPLDAILDIQAAIAYANVKSNRNVVLVGSGYSASLVLDLAATDKRVVSAFAFSPGDYFNGKFSTKGIFSSLKNKPIFIASSRTEAPDVKKYVAAIPTEKLTLFVPQKEGVHGALALAKTDPDYHDYWLSILMFIRQIP